MTSYDRHKRKKLIQKMENMRNAKERKRIEAPAPSYPPDGPGFYREIIVRDYAGHVLIREEKFFLDSDAGNINQFAVWRDRACLGVMGMWRILTEICRNFPAMRKTWD